MSSPRLRVAGARWSEYVLSWQLNGDAEARYWLGWGPSDGLHQHFHGYDPLLISADFLGFVGIEPHTGRLLAGIGLSRRDDGAYDVGGVVAAEVRGQGFGREALNAVCLVAHQHFGITRLRAGCETTNTASQRWLASCQFVRADGPPQHVLPDGRVIESMWWQRSDDTARWRCRNSRMAGS